MKNEFVLAFNEVLEERGLPKETVIDALQAALASAYRRHVNASNAQRVDAVIDAETGKVVIYIEKEIVEKAEDDRTEISLQDAVKVDANAVVGDMLIVESTPKNFGRVAAQTARQVIQQRIREAERESQFNFYSKQLGEIVSGVIQAVNSQVVTLGLEMKAEGLMPRAQQIPGERFRVHDRIRALLLEVKTTSRGPQIILSRAHRNFLRRLLENEVPEIYHGMVEIRSIAREPGQRSKVAVAALQTGVDPVGACVGIRGVRIQAIVRELNDEKIDVIEWSADPAVYIAKALSPARVSGVFLNELARGVKTATVVVPEDQLSLAIGRDGQNARLAAKLTAWKIDIKSLPEAAGDALFKLKNNPDYAQIAASEENIITQVEAILAKKDEGRPVTPEEYHLLTQFVDRVERGLIRQLEREHEAEEAELLKARANIPSELFSIPLEDFEISDRVYAVISESGLQTVGDILLQLALDEDSIWKLNGMGPKAMQELKTALEEIQNRYQVEEKSVEVVDEAADMGITELVASAISPEMDGEAVEIPELQTAVELNELETEGALSESLEEAKESVEDSIPVLLETEAVSEEPLPEFTALETTELIGEEESSNLDEIFALRPEVLDYGIPADEVEGEEETDDRKKKKGKKKKKYVEIEYDPEQDVIIAKRKHKRGSAEWEEGW